MRDSPRNVRWWIEDRWDSVCRPFRKPDPPMWGFMLDATFDPPLERGDVDAFLDAHFDEYIELIEGMDLWTGGGFGPDGASMQVYGEDMTDTKRRAVVGYFVRMGASRVRITATCNADDYGWRGARWFRDDSGYR